jgi:nucleoside 2-deoxyribosyltransferase
MRDKMKVYLAAPVVANEKTKEMVTNVYNTLVNSRGPEFDEVFRPGMHKVPNEWGISMSMWGQCVFTMDVINLDDSDWVVLCNFGRQHQGGTSWECGYAFAKGKKILVINMPGSEKDTSLMINGCAANIINYEEFMKANDLSSIFIERGKLQAKTTLN